MTSFRHFGRALFVAALSAATLVGCNQPPAFQVSQPASRDGVVESITQDTVQTMSNTAGVIGGAVVGGALGSLVGSGRGQTVATVAGATGGALAGNAVANNQQQLVWWIGVRYDDGSFATIQQTAPPAVRIGDRVRVSNNSLQVL